MAEKEKKYIIKEGDVIITSLSGPVSLSYFKPNQTIIREKKVKHTPLIVLLGDTDRGNLCKKCDCSIVTDCCHNIDENLFGLFDTLSTKENPVKVIIEDRKKYKDRHNVVLLEEFKTGFEKNLLALLVPEWREDDYLTQEWFKKKIVDPNINQDLMHDILSNIIDGKEWNYDKFTDNLFEKMKLYKSQIHDTINKQKKDYVGPINIFNIKRIFKIIFKRHWTFIGSPVSTGMRRDLDKQNFLKTKDNILGLQDILIGIYDCLKNSFNIIKIFLNIFTDINGRYPSLILCYMNDNDVETLKNIITSLNYDLVYIKNKPHFYNRCLTITELINISEDVTQHNKQIELEIKKPMIAAKPIVAVAVAVAAEPELSLAKKMKQIESFKSSNIVSYNSLDMNHEIKKCFNLYSVVGDGNCLFRTIAKYNIMKKYPQWTREEVKKKEDEYHKRVRKEICDYNETKRQLDFKRDLEPYKGDDATLRIAFPDDMEYQKQKNIRDAFIKEKTRNTEKKRRDIVTMRKNSSWGTDHEISAAAYLYNLNILCYELDSMDPYWILFDSNNEAKANASSMYMIFVNRNHYNLLMPNRNCRMIPVNRLPYIESRIVRVTENIALPSAQSAAQSAALPSALPAAQSAALPSALPAAQSAARSAALPASLPASLPAAHPIASPKLVNPPNLKQIQKIYESIKPIEKEIDEKKMEEILDEIIRTCEKSHIDDIEVKSNYKNMERMYKGLIEIQNTYFPTIIEELKRGKKEEHWNWYVFPAYFSSGGDTVDGENTRVGEDEDDLNKFLSDSRKEWIEILELICYRLHLQLDKLANKDQIIWPTVMMHADIQRMFRSIVFWLSRNVIYQPKFNSFRTALFEIAKRFNKKLFKLHNNINYTIYLINKFRSLKSGGYQYDMFVYFNHCY